MQTGEPTAEPYPILLIEPEWIQAAEQMGSKAKGWVSVPWDTERWLFKFARVNEGVPTGEHWAEKIAAEVASLLDVPHARVELAELDGRPGSLSRRFPELAEPGTELIHGNDLLAGSVVGYERGKRFRQGDHTLENILTAVSTMIPDDPGRATALQQLAGYLVLDALVLNTDRHHENWALLRVTHLDGRTTHRVAPTFDHASSLGRNEPEERLRRWETQPDRVAWYARRAHGAVYVGSGDSRGENPLRLVEIAAQRRPLYFSPVLSRVQALNPARLEAVVERVPAQTMGPAARTFAKALMRCTREQLAGVTS